jgi:hypothetical protein
MKLTLPPSLPPPGVIISGTAFLFVLVMSIIVLFLF